MLLFFVSFFYFEFFFLQLYFVSLTLVFICWHLTMTTFVHEIFNLFDCELMLNSCIIFFCSSSTELLVLHTTYSLVPLEKKKTFLQHLVRNFTLNIWIWEVFFTFQYYGYFLLQALLLVFLFFYIEFSVDCWCDVGNVTFWQLLASAMAIQVYFYKYLICLFSIRFVYLVFFSYLPFFILVYFFFLLWRWWSSVFINILLNKKNVLNVEGGLCLH